MECQLSQAKGCLAALNDLSDRLWKRSIGMKNEQNNLAGKKIPQKTVSPLHTIPAHCEDVESVLEHISSPYRWEVLDVPVVEKNTPVQKKSNKQKTRKAG